MIKVKGKKIYSKNTNIFHKKEFSLLITCSSRKNAKLVAETLNIRSKKYGIS